jgi:hypothetical protein
MECEGETPFHLVHFPPNNLYPNLQFFPLTLRFYFTMVLSRYSRLPFHFLRSINHNCAPQYNKSSTPSLLIWFWLKIWPFPFLEIMASRMVTSYGPQAAQANEELPPESSLDLTLTQHARDEEPEPWEVCAHLEVEPPWAWYYRISPNFRTLVILLQVDPASGDEPETVCEGCYKTEDTSSFAWSSGPSVGHYRWLHGLIRRLPPNSKADYLVRTIRCILDFLQLWTITKA